MKITRVFFGVDMRQNFDGLHKVAAQAKTPILSHSVLVFINTKRTMFKMLSGDKYLVYYKAKTGRMPIEALRYLPQGFGGSEMEMTGAIKQSLKEKGVYDAKKVSL